MDNLDLGSALRWPSGARIPAARRVRGGAPATAARAGHTGELRLTRRGRWVLAVVASAVAVGTGIVGGQAVAAGPTQALEVVGYTVQPGDTLWRIAADVAVPGEDVRDVIVELQDLNGLPRAELTAGQHLVLPAHR
ncbi:hypothetical protein DDP54_15080 [Cellulomonas sp. WB94]|nr:hypothetical protein DDP54_15080 [Cellulomonas sp. WB94]